MGHRIELGEIEGVMEQIDQVSRACCIFDEEKKKILGFYKGEIEKRELKRKMHQELLCVYFTPNHSQRQNGGQPRARPC